MKKAGQSPAPLDVRELSDDEAIRMVELTTRDTRWLWIMALSFTHGRSGVPYLRALLEPGKKMAGTHVSAALASLSLRDREAAAEASVPLLKHRSFEVQLGAVSILMSRKSEAELGHVYGWIAQRLRKPSRYDSGGDFEMPWFIRFAAESDTLPTLLSILDECENRLEPYEIERIERVWPEAARQRIREGSGQGSPSLDEVRAWESESTAGGQMGEEEEAESLSRSLQRSWDSHRRRAGTD